MVVRSHGSVEGAVDVSVDVSFVRNLHCRHFLLHVFVDGSGHGGGAVALFVLFGSRLC